MFDDQTKKFTEDTENFDYRTLTADDGSLLGDYFNMPLLDFFQLVLKMSGDSSSRFQSLKLKMAIGMLCNIKNPSSIMMQTIIGLGMYANGLRDSGFEILNKFGVSCGIKHIRRMANKWCELRKCIDEIDIRGFWRLTFDNLNFRRKYAKTFKDGGDVGGRQLDLLTGQASRRDVTAQQGAYLMMDFEETQMTCPADFKLHNRGKEKSAWLQYMAGISQCHNIRMSLSVNNMETKLIEDLEDHMPNFTPSCKDNIVYGTVSAAKSSSVNDIANYLHSLKKDFHIGEAGYPQQVLLAGDQQTYAIVKNLMLKYPETFS
jgi:hypothetical protein